MLHVHFIQSLDLPELEPYRTMRRTVEHERQGIFVAEGEKVVRRLLQANLAVISLLVTSEWLEQLRPALESRAEEIHAYVADKLLLQALVGFELYQGVLALARIPPAPVLAEVLAQAERPRLLVALDGLTNSTNLGVVVRDCAAFRVQALLIGETCSSPWLRRSVRNSMGAIFQLPTIQSENLAPQLQQLRLQNFSIVAAHPHPGAQSLSTANFTSDCCIVFGSEGYGISEPVLTECDEQVVIPMPAHVDSLNVGSAVSAFLYEANRQRGRM